MRGAVAEAGIKDRDKQLYPTNTAEITSRCPWYLLLAQHPSYFCFENNTVNIPFQYCGNWCNIVASWENKLSTHIKVSDMKLPNLQYMRIIQQILQRSGIKDVIV